MYTMNRCHRFLLLRQAALALNLVLGLLVLHPVAEAQMMVRQFPATVKRGVMTVGAPPEVSINGSVLRLAPGVRIRGPNNMLVHSGALIGQRMPVNYVLESHGLVRDIWILNAAEEAVQPKGWDTVTNFVFESDADKPKVDDGKTPYNQLPGFPKK
jgi:hypothetical protein